MGERQPSPGPWRRKAPLQQAAGRAGLREDLDYCCKKTRGSRSELVQLAKMVCGPQRPCVWVEEGE